MNITFILVWINNLWFLENSWKKWKINRSDLKIKKLRTNLKCCYSWKTFDYVINKDCNMTNCHYISKKQFWIFWTSLQNYIQKETVLGIGTRLWLFNSQCNINDFIFGVYKWSRFYECLVPSIKKRKNQDMNNVNFFY